MNRGPANGHANRAHHRGFNRKKQGKNHRGESPDEESPGERVVSIAVALLQFKNNPAVVMLVHFVALLCCEVGLREILNSELLTQRFNLGIGRKYREYTVT
jgi:hypothetical protein